MRVAELPGPWTPIPPPLYGGVETVVDHLALALQAAGHQVTLYTTADSTCAVPRRAVLGEAEGDRIGHTLPELRYVLDAYAQLEQVEVIHDHTLLGPFHAQQATDIPVVATIHGPLDGELGPIYRRIAAQVSLVAISESQRAAAPDIPIARVIHHGVDTTAFPFRAEADDYFLFLGRLDPDKGAHRAIAAATKAGVPLVLAGKMRAPHERAYFEAEVRPHLDSERIWYLGEVPHRRKLDLLAKARCLLMPIRWPEPFGMVVLEALACGTPVLAFPAGAVPEIVDHGRTGLLCGDEADMAEGILEVGLLDRCACRAEVEQRFSARRMAAEYAELFSWVV